ncbi:MAG: nucleotide exchange factor GrpE [Candidatus Latescibacteria bacterium]|nr:nucleotide exchange factor GrpE [Candidatus Latescibacterota bacterium]
MIRPKGRPTPPGAQDAAAAPAGAPDPAAAAGAAKPAAALDPEDVAAELERARAREDDLLRALAELTNVNRRRKQEMEFSLLYAQEALIRDLLPVLDDIDRALEASKSETEDPIRAGLVLIRDRLWRTLEKEGLAAIQPDGDRFDPEVHDAVAHRPAPGVPADTVLEVTLPGYRLKGRVLRHAQVVVAAAHAEGNPR